MDLGVIMLSVISQTEKDMCSLYVESKKTNEKNITKHKQIQGE